MQYAVKKKGEVKMRYAVKNRWAALILLLAVLLSGLLASGAVWAAESTDNNIILLNETFDTHTFTGWSIEGATVDHYTVEQLPNAEFVDEKITVYLAADTPNGVELTIKSLSKRPIATDIQVSYFAGRALHVSQNLNKVGKKVRMRPTGSECILYLHTMTTLQARYTFEFIDMDTSLGGEVEDNTDLDIMQEQVELENGQFGSDWEWVGANDALLYKDASFDAVIEYGEAFGRFYIDLPAGVTAYYKGRAAYAAPDGRTLLELPASVEGTASQVTLRNANGKEKTYTFTCYAQNYPDLPDRVSEYLCIASQYTNTNGIGPYGFNAVATLRGTEYDITSGDEMQGPVSLGSEGGYIVYYYRDGFKDDPHNPYGIELMIAGNTGPAAEPGQVWVSEDGSKWYALAGSNHYDESVKWGAEITYESNANRNAYIVQKNGEKVEMFFYPVPEYYPLFNWTEQNVERMTLKAIAMEPGGERNEYGNQVAQKTAFGYVDTTDYRDTNEATNPYIKDAPNAEEFDLAWAVDENGLPVDVSGKTFHYVKIQSMMSVDNGAIGEVSPEVNGCRLAKASSRSVGRTVAPAAIYVDGRKLALQPGVNVYEASVSGEFAVKVDAPKNYNVYINGYYAPDYNNSVMFRQAPHGIVRLILQEGEKEPLIYYIKIAQDNTLAAEEATAAAAAVATETGQAVAVPAGDNVNVTFRLIGSSLAGDDIDLSDGDYQGAAYQTWLPTRQYTVPAGSSVSDLINIALAQNAIRCDNPSGSYITKIYAPAILGGYGLEEFTNGPRSGWMFTLNGTHATQSVLEQGLQNGDVVIVHYVNDYLYEVEDWNELGGSDFAAVGDGSLWAAWLKAADTDVYTALANSGVTRAEVVRMLYAAAVARGEAGAKGDLSAFADSAAVASADKDAFAWAVGAGVVIGDKEGRLRPNDAISAAEAKLIAGRI